LTHGTRERIDVKRRTKTQAEEDVALVFGCMALFIFALGVAWCGFLGWMLYMLITWLVNK